MQNQLTLEEMGKNPSVRLGGDGTSVVIIDQTKLPNETVYLELTQLEEMYEAIHQLRVRGAPAIGIFAAYSAYVLAARSKTDEYNAFAEEFHENMQKLDSSRLTAVNLRLQLERMERCVKDNSGLPVSEIVEKLRGEAFAIHREDIAMCKAISEYGLTLVRDGDGILTHCNAGPLATSRYGTGLGTLLLARERGINLRAYVDETRPLLQGARLTAYELTQANVDTTLVCDNMASIVMREKRVNAVFVGCDRVAANGDAANKIGTSGAAIIAKHYGVPFYVFCPSSTIDLKCNSGRDIVIEQRSGEEIYRKFFEKPVAPEGVNCYNPAFDVTDNELITAIITERGILRAPYEAAIRSMFGNA